MSKFFKFSALIFILLNLFIACSSSDKPEVEEIDISSINEKKSYGSKGSAMYAKVIWRALLEARLAGPKSIRSVPYNGTHPHGNVTETLASDLKIGKHRAQIYVNKSYEGKGISRSKVANERLKFLKSVYVMFKREKGYDEKNQNWFWAKYTPNGEVVVGPNKLPLAGRVAKGKRTGCIACHKGAPGADYIFSNSASQLDR